ncbi:MAG: hypothetical protein Q4F38_03215 [Akkermansia sp.]|nr:hypothetical protein [Akkermansia sp.]
MSILSKIRQLLNPEQRSLKSRIVANWKAKLICLLIAILIWLWVDIRYVDGSNEWGLDEIRRSIPE